MIRGIHILALVLLLAAGISTVAFYHQGNVKSSISTEAPATHTISLVGYSTAWNHTNPTITVTTGESVTINLSSGDTLSHLFLLDMDGDGYSDQADCRTTDQCSSSFQHPTTFTFTAGAAGSYTYYCTFHPLTMHGIFIIQPAQSQATPDFALSASPTSVQGTTNLPATSTITVAQTGGLASDVTFTTTINPSLGLVCVIPQVNAPPASQTTQLSCTATAPGDYTVVVNGVASTSTGEVLTRSSAPITFHITAPSMGFTLTPSPATVSCATGEVKTVTIAVADTGGFNGMVTLSSSVTPGPGLSAQLAPTSVTGSGTSTLTLTCNTSGNYQVKATGTATGGTVSPVSITIPVSVTQTQQQGSFTIGASPSTINVFQGCQNMSAITLTSTGFTGNLTLTSNISPASSHVVGALNSVHVHLSIDQSQHVLLVVSADENATVGSYTVTVTASNGSISNSTVVHVNVLMNSCHVQQREGCSSKDDGNETVDNSDQNGKPCNDSDNRGARHGIENCANNDRDDHEKTTTTNCGCPGASSSQEKNKHHEDTDESHEDHHKECTTSCDNGGDHNKDMSDISMSNPICSGSHNEDHESMNEQNVMSREQN